MLTVKKRFKGLKRGCLKSLGVRKLGGGKKCVYCNITGMRNEKSEWIILAHSSNLDNPCDLYRDRWQIESLFRAMKTGGFQLESAHITDPQRLECLIGVACMAYVICYKSGKTAYIERWNNTLRQRLSHFLRRTFSFSKSKEMQEVCLQLFIHNYNNSIKSFVT